MDIAIVIEKLVPSANYFGSLTANDEAAYDALQWSDERTKPTFAQLIAASGPTYQERLSALNIAYQLDVDMFNKAFAIAYLADGPTQEAKQATIRSQYLARKSQHTANIAALKIEYGV